MRVRPRQRAASTWNDVHASLASHVSRFSRRSLLRSQVEEEYHSERTWESDRFTPQECRLRDISYTAPVKVDVEYTVSDFLKCSRYSCANH